LPIASKQTVKILLLLLAGALLSMPCAHADENRYDVLSKLLMPFISVLAKTTKNPNRAMMLAAHVERLTGLPPELQNAHAEVSLEFPDRLVVRGPILGENLALCRNGQQVWATPGEKVQALLDAATAGKKLPQADAAPLEPLQLPLPEKQLVFLPALFVVKDAGVEEVEGAECRVLDVTLMQDLEKSLKDKWAARVWVGADYKPSRLLLTRAGWELAIKFEKVVFAPKLAASTWQPPAEDVLQLDAARFRQLVRAIVK
jgi:hypothetical protein